MVGPEGPFRVDTDDCLRRLSSAFMVIMALLPVRPGPGPLRSQTAPNILANKCLIQFRDSVFILVSLRNVGCTVLL